jgi:ABC-type multidrug transport system ATPase subunit
MTAPSQAMVETTVDVRHVTVRYGRKVAVDGVSFAIPQGAVFALLGRNGAGKSSLVRCLLGRTSGASAPGSWNGSESSARTPTRRRR